MDIKAYLRERRGLVDSFLRSYFDDSVIPASLGETMAYSVFAGGKRVRPLLAIASYEACGGKTGDIIPYASALELIHTYSLIHDDLPAMDDDDLRRGKPTSHKVFGEGMAILAGDALSTEAFYLLSNTYPPSNVRVRDVLRVIREVALAAGAHGMVGGQVQDILSEGREMDEEDLAFIHAHKTGALITVSVRMGAILGKAGKRKIKALTVFGENIGLAFQIIDDLLDVRGDSSNLGKPTGSDKKNRKLTYPGLYGIDSSMKKAEDLLQTAISALAPFSAGADPLRELARYILSRKN